jgi:hypothetical protein
MYMEYGKIMTEDEEIRWHETDDQLFLAQLIHCNVSQERGEIAWTSIEWG